MNTSLDEIFGVLHQSQTANQRSIDQTGRVVYPVLCSVTDNADPEHKRRIRVSDPAKPGLNSDWLRRSLDCPYLDPPLPPVGSTVLCFFVEGNELNGWYQSCVNATNPPLDKVDEQLGYAIEVPGERRDRTRETHDISVGKSLTLTTDSGASIVLTESGAIELRSAGGVVMTLDSDIQITATDVQIQGKSAIVIGSIDTRGDANITRGY
jgi:hypothetical protein